MDLHDIHAECERLFTEYLQAASVLRRRGQREAATEYAGRATAYAHAAAMLKPLADSEKQNAKNY